MKKKLFINFILIIIVYFLFEIISLLIMTFQYKEQLYINMKNDGHSILNQYFPKTLREQNPEKYKYYFREPIIINNSNKNDIVIYGCSFAYGAGLSNEESFGGQLAKLTKRNVYNRAIGGLGPQMMLYDIQKNDIKNIIQNVDLFIYLYMDDHINRTLMFRNYPFLHKVQVKYILNPKVGGGKLLIKKPNFYQKYSFVYRLLESYMRCKDNKYKYDLFFSIIKEFNNKSKELYPNSKFVILNYSDKPLPMQEQIQKLGIKVISNKDLTDKNMFTTDYYISNFDHHPNKKVWEELTPPFVKKLEL